MNIPTEVIVAAVAALAGWLGNRLTVAAGRARTAADTKAVEVATLGDVIGELRSELDRLRFEVDDLRGENAVYKRHNEELQALVVALEAEIVSLGGDPGRIRAHVARLLDAPPIDPNPTTT